MPSSARRRRLWVTAAVVACLVGCDAGSGTADRPDTDAAGVQNEASDVGVTADTLTLGAHYPPTDTDAPDVQRGATVYFAHVNTAGGVDGRRLEYLVADDAVDPDDPLRAVRRLVDGDDVFAVVGGGPTPAPDAVQDFLNAEGVPDLFASPGSPSRGEDPVERPYTFGWQPDPLLAGETVGRYVAAELPGARIGLLLRDDDLGRDRETGVRAHVAADRVVAVQRYPAGSTDVGPQVAALAAAGADVVVAPADPALARRLPDGALTTAFLPTLDEDDDPWIRLFRSIWAEHGDGGELTDGTVSGMAMAWTVVQALQAAGRNPTRERLVEALEQAGGGFDGPVRGPLGYSQDSHLGAGGVAVLRVDDGRLRVVAPAVGEDGGGERPPASGIPDEEFYE